MPANLWCRQCWSSRAVSGVTPQWLGLPIARTLVEAAGGRLWMADDGGGGGATFLFTLPAAGEIVPLVPVGLPAESIAAGR